MFVPDPAEAITDILDVAGARTFVAFPATVERYDADTRTVDVRPGLLGLHYDLTGEKSTEELPVIPHVRVVRFRAGGFRIDAPSKKGDGVLVVCCDRDPSAWFDTGEPSDPGDERYHGLQGAVAIAGLFPSSQEGADPGHLVISCDDGPTIHVKPTEVVIEGASIKLTSSDVQLGGAGDYAALASKVDQNFQTLATLLTSLAVVGTAAGGLAVTGTASGTFSPAPVAATKVKAE
jgi:hypothetical protein